MKRTAINLALLSPLVLLVGATPAVSSPAMLIILLMLSLFITLALGFYVLVAAPQHAVNRAFTLFNGLMILWIVKDIAFWGFHEADSDGYGWAVSSFLIGLALQYALLLFTDVFPDNALVRWRRLGWLALPLLAFIPALLAGHMWEHVGFRDHQFALQVKPAAYVYGAFSLAMLGFGFVQLARKYRAERGTLRGQQIGSVMVAQGVTAILTAIGVNILPIFGRYELLPLSSLFIVVGSLIYAYAISSFQLFSLQSALDQLRLFPLAYKVSLAVAATGLSGFFLFQAPVAWWSFGGDAGDWRRFIVFSTITGLVPSLLLILLIFKILSRPLRMLTETA